MASPRNVIATHETESSRGLGYSAGDQGHDDQLPKCILVEVLTQGFEKYHIKLMNSPQSADVQNRLKAEFQSIGTIATLLKGIVMHFAGSLHSYRPIYMVQDEIGDGEALHWPFYAYAGLLVVASFLLLTSILMSLINMICVSLLTPEQISIYMAEAPTTIKLPFIALVYGVVVWHMALGVLMFYLVEEFRFGVFFSVTVTAVFIMIGYQYSCAVGAVDRAWRAKPSVKKA